MTPATGVLIVDPNLELNHFLLFYNNFLTL